MFIYHLYMQTLGTLGQLYTFKQVGCQYHLPTRFKKIDPTCSENAGRQFRDQSGSLFVP